MTEINSDLFIMLSRLKEEWFLQLDQLHLSGQLSDGTTNVQNLAI